MFAGESVAATTAANSNGLANKIYDGSMKTYTE